MSCLPWQFTDQLFHFRNATTGGTFCEYHVTLLCVQIRSLLFRGEFESVCFVQEFQEYPTLSKNISSLSRPWFQGIFRNDLLAFHLLLISGSHDFRNDFRGSGFERFIMETRVERSASFMWCLGVSLFLLSPSWVQGSHPVGVAPSRATILSLITCFRLPIPTPFAFLDLAFLSAAFPTLHALFLIQANKECPVNISWTVKVFISCCYLL